MDVVGTAEDRAVVTKLDEALRRVNSLIHECAMKGVYIEIHPTERQDGDVVTQFISYRAARPILPL